MSDSVNNVATVVVTPEMIEAGFQILNRSGLSDEYLEADKLTLAQIYRAMFAHRPLNEAVSLDQERHRTC